LPNLRAAILKYLSYWRGPMPASGGGKTRNALS
jgi:hypothetical protein